MTNVAYATHAISFSSVYTVRIITYREIQFCTVYLIKETKKQRNWRLNEIRSRKSTNKTKINRHQPHQQLSAETDFRKFIWSTKCITILLVLLTMHPAYFQAQSQGCSKGIRSETSYLRIWDVGCNAFTGIWFQRPWQPCHYSHCFNRNPENCSWISDQVLRKKNCSKIVTVTKQNFLEIITKTYFNRVQLLATTARVNYNRWSTHAN